nr:hypothetical protein [Tanacetum cinerariifolium]
DKDLLKSKDPHTSSSRRGASITLGASGSSKLPPPPPPLSTDIDNNWASALVLTYEPPAENSLLANSGDMTTFLNWYCQKINKTVLTQADFEGQAYEVVKAFYPYVVHLQFQMEERHKMLADQINWADLKDDQGRIDVSRKMLLGGPP